MTATKKWYDKNRYYSVGPITDEYNHRWEVDYVTGKIGVMIPQGNHSATCVPFEDLGWEHLSKNQLNIISTLKLRVAKEVVRMKNICSWEFTKDMDERLPEDFHTPAYCTNPKTRMLKNRPYCDHHHPMTTAEKKEWVDRYLERKAISDEEDRLLRLAEENVVDDRMFYADGEEEIAKMNRLDAAYKARIQAYITKLKNKEPIEVEVVESAVSTLSWLQKLLRGDLFRREWQ